MLELLPGALLVRVSHRLVVDFNHVRKSVDDESAEQHGVAHLVLFDGQTYQARQCFELRNLDERVNVVVLEEQTLQFLEPLKLRDVRRRNDVVKAHVLERNLLDGLLEVRVVQHF